MTFADEVEVYDPRRYLAAISVLDYQESATIDDLDFYSHADPSLEAEIEALEELGLVKEDTGEYKPSEEYREDFAEVGRIVQIEYNGKWEDVEISNLDNDRAEIIGWVI